MNVDFYCLIYPANATPCARTIKKQELLKARTIKSLLARVIREFAQELLKARIIKSLLARVIREFAQELLKARVIKNLSQELLKTQE